MTKRGKTLTFTQEELEDLLELRYGDARTFTLLTLLFENVDTRKILHVDHIFPISRFTPRKLQSEGIPEEKAETSCRVYPMTKRLTSIAVNL